MMSSSKIFRRKIAHFGRGQGNSKKPRNCSHHEKKNESTERMLSAHSDP